MAPGICLLVVAFFLSVPQQSVGQSPPIVPEASSPQQPGTEFRVDVRVGSESNNVQDLNQVGFDLSFEQQHLSHVEDEEGSFLGDVQYASNVDSDNGIVSVGVTRTDDVGKSGSGVVARVRLAVGQNVAGGTELTFSVQNVRAEDPSGNSIDLNPRDLDVTVQGESQPPPTASFTFDPSVPEVGETVTFDAGGSEDPNGSVVEYRWDFDEDGQAEATGQTASTSFSSAGDKAIGLTVVDDDGATGSATETVPVNAPPTASDDSAQTGEGQPTTTDVLANDSDPDGDGLDAASVQVESGPSDGSATANSDGTITYAPGGGFTGTDSYTYTVADTEGARSGEATVTITVESQPPPTASFTFDPSVPEVGETVTFDASGSEDPNGSVVEYRWDFDEDGQAEATGQTASTSFSSAGDKAIGLTVVDDDGATGSATETVPVNAPPTASDDSAQTGEGQPTTTDVLANDSDPDGDGLDAASVQVESGPSDGSATANSDGTITYAPGGGFTGTDSYTYTVADTEGARSGEATVTITVESQPPPTASFTFDPSVPEVGETVTFDAGGSEDPNGSVVEYRWDFDEDGQAEATGQTASTSFSSAGDKAIGLTVVDDDGATGSATETVPVNAPPTASDDSAQTGEGQPTTTDVLANDSDPDGDGLDAASVQVESGPSDGSATANSDGTITYAPGGGFTGTDSYTYTVADTEGARSGEATVTITVESQPPPTASFTFDPSVPEVGETVTFDASGSEDPNGSVVEYRWDFDEDGQAEATGQTASTSFSSAGDKAIGLTVVDDDGATGSATETVEVRDFGEPFITVWETTSPDSSVTIPTDTSNSSYDFVIDWGDGTTETYTGADPDPTHSYDQAGTYTVEISGTFPRIYLNAAFNGSGDRANARRLQSIEQWGDIQWESMAGAFSGAENVTYDAGDTPDLSSVSSMALMFGGAQNFNGEIGDWDVSGVIDMVALFAGAENFNRDIGAWNVSNVLSMSFMFFDAQSFNQDISAWDVSNVFLMDSMFSGSSNFNRDIGSWQTGNVTEMGAMFNGATSFNQNIGGWDVSSVEGMAFMFAGASTFNQDIGSWNVSNVTNMHAMFADATSFDQDLGDWDVSSVDDSQPDSPDSFEDFLALTELSSSNYDALLKGWQELDLTDGLTFDAGQSQYTSDAQAARQNIIDEEGWTINDGGLVGSNQPPTASDDSDQTEAGQPTTTDVLANDSDPDGDLAPSTVQVESGPSNGSASANSDGTITYAPGGGFTGTDSYTYTVADTEGARSGEATVTIEVTDNAPPTASFTFDPSEPNIGETVTFDASGSEDPNGSVVEYRWDFDEDGQAEATGQTASTSFSSAGEKAVGLTVVDDDGATGSATETVPVEAANQPPAAPTGLTANAADRKVRLNWAPNTEDDLAGYNLYRSTSSFGDISEATKLNDSLIAGTDYTDTEVSGGTEYFYRATAVDTTPNESALSVVVSAFVSPSQVAASINRTFGDASEPGDYRLVALPGAPDTTLASVVTGEAGSEWQAYRETDGALQRYDGSEEDFSFRKGRGYWLTSRQEWALEDSIDAVSLRDSTTAIPLNDGWTIVANPFGEAVSFSALRRVNGGDLQALWPFGGAFSDTSETFESAKNGRAYYLFNGDSDRDSLQVPHPALTIVGGKKAPKHQAQKASSSNEQRMMLSLSARPVGKGSEDASEAASIVRLGLIEGGEPRSLRAPPGGLEETSLRIVRAEKGKEKRLLMADRRPAEGEGETFQVRLTSQVEGPVQIRARTVDSPEGASVALLDRSQEKTYDLRGTGPIQVTPGEEKRRFEVAIGTDSYVEGKREEVIPDEVSLTSYPNPARRQSTLEYTLPGPREVSLQVYDVLGRRVVTLEEGRKKAGRHQVRLETDQLSSGVYFGRLKVGEQTRTQKITVVR